MLCVTKKREAGDEFLHAPGCTENVKVKTDRMVRHLFNCPMHPRTLFKIYLNHVTTYRLVPSFWNASVSCCSSRTITDIAPKSHAVVLVHLTKVVGHDSDVG